VTGRAGGIAGLLLAATVAARAGTPAPPASLASLLAATGADGAPLLAPAARAYVDGLPDRARAALTKAVADELITSGGHLAAILGLALSPESLEFATSDRCFLCHTDPETHTGDTLLSADPGAHGAPPHMALASVVKDVHFRRGLSCAGCHGGDPSDPMGHDFPASWPDDAAKRRRDRAWIPAFCGRCHSDAAFMRRFNPALPTDQVEKYHQSRHGALLAAGDSRAAQCVSCHGAHGIQGAKSPLSTVYPTRVPETCAHCHADPAVMSGFQLPDGSPIQTNQYEQYRASVHGRALLERGDLGAPACNDCHGNHAAMPPQVASVSQICRNCHARNGTLFDGSRHKQAFEAHGWPECDTCHGKHAIQKTSDALLAPGPTSLCEACHRQYATANPECIAAATYFHDELLHLASGHAAVETQVEDLARLGLDVEPMHDELTKLLDTLKQTRSYVHAFNRSEFAQVADQGEASLGRLAELQGEAKGELRFRFRGLAVAVGLIALLMLLLWLKVRRLERNERDDGR